ncbi:MAG: LLM class F420-dependent oxidoreductase [Acidimicrobiales bacterium]|nr:LLM class F420-dependent oxidoreductase [Acidimicrobiales bacterium]
MRHFVTYPLVAHPSNPELVTKQAIVRFATRAEELGFDGMGFTDHPAPSHRWLQAGGHDALDPFVALGVVAAVTERLRLVPNILVLPYRNPFLVAKAAATLDAVSDGRFVLAVATGYQRGEYRALGVDFDERNQLFDESLEVIRSIWTEDEVAYEGLHFTARDQTANPKPGHVPVWIGGNSALSRRRVATSADGWSPFPAPATLAKTAKTPVLESIDDLTPMLDHLWRCVDEAGRDPSTIDISMQALGCAPPGDESFDPEQHLDALGTLAELGVTWTSTGLPGHSLDAALEALERYATTVIAPQRVG